MGKLLPICAIVLSLAAAGYSHYLASDRSASRHDPTYLKRAVDEGRLSFDVRGLKNVHPGAQSVSYTHTATVVASGDVVLSGLPFVAYFSVRRVSGGDPEDPRGPEEWVPVLLRDGYGELELHGGFRSGDDAWAPERIELHLVGVSPVIPVAGQPVAGPPS